MAKIALLIGVSEYEPGLNGLPSAVNDVTAMQQVLTNLEMGEFGDENVTVLQNPDRQTMADAIYHLFANRQRDDLVLLYFSGHGVDDGNEFYLEPYRQRRAKVDRYRTVFEGAIAKRYPLSQGDRRGLQRFQQLLSLRDEDVSAIQEQVLDSFLTKSVSIPETTKPEKSNDIEGETDKNFTFERFTARAIKVIMLAQEESRRLGHNFVGSEQILLGLIGVGTGIAVEVLKSSGANSLKDVRAEVETIIGRGSGLVANETPFTPKAEQIIKQSLEESRQLGHNLVDTEHLLLGVIQNGDGVAGRVLENLGVNLQKLRSLVLQTIQGAGR